MHRFSGSAQLAPSRARHQNLVREPRPHAGERLRGLERLVETLTGRERGVIRATERESALCGRVDKLHRVFLVKAEIDEELRIEDVDLEGLRAHELLERQ